MSTKRSRPPTDELLTDIYEAKDLPARPKTSTAKGVPEGVKPAASRPAHPSEPKGHPAEGVKPAASGPIRVISMKTPAELESEKPAPKQHRVEIRSMAEVHRRHDTPPGGFGHLAPPRDPKEVRARKVRDYLIWGSAVVILGCAVMLGVWFLARS